MQPAKMRRCHTQLQRIAGHVVAQSTAAAPAPEGATAASIEALAGLCATVARRATHLRVDFGAAERFADSLTETAFAALAPPPPPPHELEAAPEEWAALVMAQMAVNFCYFPDPGEPRWWVVSAAGEAVGVDDEANAMTSCLRDTWAACGGFASGAFLEQLSDAAVAEIFAPAPGAGVLPMLAERAAALRKIGAALKAAGGAAAFVASADGSALRFAGLLGEHGFLDQRDGASHGVSQPLSFFKRAQLCAASLSGAGMPGFTFGDIERLTVFSDYRLPQLFAEQGILHLTPHLAVTVKAELPVDEGSAQEVELRAATVAISDTIVQRVAARTEGRFELTAAKLDYFLWRSAVVADEAGEYAEFPFHRTRTTSY